MTRANGNHRTRRSNALPKPLRQIWRKLRPSLPPSPTDAPFPESELGPLVRQDWDKWNAARTRAKKGPRVLIATGIGGHPPSTVMEAFLAAALTLRGANVEFFLCDKQLPACLMCNFMSFESPEQLAIQGPQAKICNWCYPRGRAMYAPFDLPIRTFGEFLTDAMRARAQDIAAQVPLAEIQKYKFEGLEIGAHAFASAVRFFVKSDFWDEPTAEPILRRYLEAALLSAFATRALLRATKYEVAVFHHGIYVSQGIFGEVARQEQVRVVNWGPAYRKHSFLFSHHRSHHFTLLQEPSSVWENLKWTPEMAKDLMEYVSSRWTGQNDWLGVSPIHQPTDTALGQEIGIDFSKPTIGLLTNVLWDAQLFYEGNAYRDMRDWVFDTIEFFSKRPDLQLLIRVHPAEVRGTLVSREQIIPAIYTRFPQLPKNIVIVPPESSVDTYRAMMQCDSVIIYGTKTGMELATLGIPILVAGEAWVRDKGITLDAHTRDEYLELLERLPLRERLDEKTVERARKYAYHFFFRKMIPVYRVQPAPGEWKSYRFDLDRLEDLRAADEIGLDVICDGILNGREFIYPAENLRARAPVGVGI